jgi:transcription elongation GreA/GreB family factor
MLPFEDRALRAELGRLGLAQGELSTLLGEAMGQSSETWHDNAPADAVNLQSKVVTGRAEQVIKYLQHGVLVAYPAPDETSITLGSVIGIQYPDTDEVDQFLLTGVSRTVPELKPDTPYENLDVVTVRSPLGAAILGAIAGDNLVYVANQRSLNVNIVDVAQFNPQNLLQHTS